MNSSIQANIAVIHERIRCFAQKYARGADSVQLLAVSKTRSAHDVQQAFDAGQRHFGENYLQEALDKQQHLTHLPLIWHFIGPIQSNKTRLIAEHFSWVHSVDRLKIAERLSEQRPADLPDLKVLVQVNPDNEHGKAGISLSALPELAHAVARLPRLQLCGLMAIPAPAKTLESQRLVFRQLRLALETLQGAGLEQCTDLSMGMSGDYEAAIAEGATFVRIGTDIFGARD
jgi:pyridoxal phosphate enzyme (YggS family)